MDNLDEEMRGLLLSGVCCTSAMVQLALEETGQENPELVAKVAPLCHGLATGLTCGALIAGLLVLAIFRGDRPVDRMTIRHYVEWFRSEFGTLECADLVDDDPLSRAMVCPPIIAAAYRKARELGKDG